MTYYNDADMCSRNGALHHDVNYVVKSPQLVSAVEGDPRSRRTESKWM